jgi:flagellar basal-body rod protein FlgC
MNVIANNIANAQTTDVGDGTPYRRKEVEFLGVGEELQGVDLGEVVDDYSQEFKKVFQGVGYPGADAQGYVTMPNVEVPVEMMNMVVASRAYQASVAVLKKYQEVSDATLELLR